MGIMTSSDRIPDLQRLKYEMTNIKSKDLIHIWLLGPPGSGRHTIAKQLSDSMDLVLIEVTELLRKESATSTDRGKYIKSAINCPYRKVPDFIVIDLIKEELISWRVAVKGFIYNGFPRTVSQGLMFKEEIGNINALVYLTAKTNVLIQRTLLKHKEMTPEKAKTKITRYVKEAKKITSKFASELEKFIFQIKADGTLVEVHSKIETAIGIRLNLQAISPEFHQLKSDDHIKSI